MIYLFFTVRKKEFAKNEGLILPKCCSVRVTGWLEIRNTDRRGWIHRILAADVMAETGWVGPALHSQVWALKHDELTDWFTAQAT